MNQNRTFAQEFLGEMSPAGQRTAQALSPYQQFRISGSVTPPSQRNQVGDSLVAFDQLDPADDSFMEKQAVIFQGADPQVFRSPSVQNKIRQANAAHAEAQAYFKEDPELVDFYISQRSQNVAPQVAIEELRNQARDRSLKKAGLKSGLLETEYESLRDPATGKVDQFKLMDFVNRREREASVKKAAAPKELPPEAYSRIDKARSDTETLMAIANDPARLAAYYKDKTKKEMLGDKVNRTDEAWKMIDAELKDSRNAYERYLQSYGRSYVMPPEFGGGNAPLSPAPDVGTPAVTPAMPEATTPPIAQQPQGMGPATAPVKEGRTEWLQRNARKF
jgi:hypothetical protein